MSSYSEAIKEVLRVALFSLVSWLLTDGVLDWLLGRLFGAYLTPADKTQIIFLLTLTLRGIDKYLHQEGKLQGDESMMKGLSRF